MQNLILDFGNTLFKAAVFEQDKLLSKISDQHLQKEMLLNLKKQYPEINKTIYSTVIDLEDTLTEYLNKELNAIELTHHTLIPLKNLYQTPETLGKDRLAAAVGAFQLFPNKNLLVIDAGSCITYDMITESKHYLGGSISPGITIRFKSLHHYTDKLPLLNPSGKEIALIGKSTRQSILSGVLNGVFAEVDGIINRYKETYPDLIVLFTGGDLKHFDKNLKNNIFAAENLVLQGLNFILNYNDKNKA